ncbi:MAG: xanthine dehydrogenase family protein molybdopterin-binding subunit, partial [Gammaproteobacteria bacterium]
MGRTVKVLEETPQRASAGPFVGRSVERVEDLTLLRGRGRFADDLPVPPGLSHAAFLRASVPHARISSLDTERAKAMPGVHAVVTGEDVQAHSSPFITAVKVDAPQHALATDRIRYVGEPLAIVIADSRYVAEDALDLIEVRLEPLDAITDPAAAAASDAPRLHPRTDSNVLHERCFSYGEADAAFANADRVVETTVSYPRNACTPIECLCVISQYDPGEASFEITANFQGPYTLHGVMARALGVPGNKLRLKTPADSGGSYGVKQAVFPYVVALGVAAKLAGRAVKWVEDRLEHL